MGRRDDSPPRRPEPSYRFDSYEDGKPKWAPQTPTEDPRGNRGCEDNRRDSRRQKERYEDDAPPPPRESQPQPRKHRSYSASESDSDAPPVRPPRRSNTTRHSDRRPRDHYDSYDEHPRRDDRRRDNRGYVSDDRHNRPRRDDDRDRRDRRRDDKDRSRDRSRDRYDDRDRDRRRDDRDRRDRHRDDRRDDRYRDDRKDDRKKSTPYDALFSMLAAGSSGSKDRDRRDRDYDRRDRDGRPGQLEWQKQAMGMFTAYALPIIKKEGTKYLANKMGGGGKRR